MICTVLLYKRRCIVIVFCHCIAVKRLGSCTGHSPPIKFITFMTICLSIYQPCSLTVSPFIHHHHYLFYPFAPDLPIGPFIHHCDYQFDPVYIRQHFTIHWRFWSWPFKNISSFLLKALVDLNVRGEMFVRHFWGSINNFEAPGWRGGKSSLAPVKEIMTQMPASQVALFSVTFSFSNTEFLVEQSYSKKLRLNTRLWLFLDKIKSWEVQVQVVIKILGYYLMDICLKGKCDKQLRIVSSILLKHPSSLFKWILIVMRVITPITNHILQGWRAKHFTSETFITLS